MGTKTYTRPRTFRILRLKDVSGVSGEGLVAEGCVFHDGQAVLSWFGRHHTIEVAPNIEDIIAIHGHNGLTKVIFDDYDTIEHTEKRR